MNSYKCLRENWKRFKNCSYFCQTRVFRDLIKSPHSRQIKPPKHSRTKIWKIFLSVCRNWKVYLRVSRELNRENLWVTLATGPSTCEQVAKKSPDQAAKTLKDKNLKKFSKCFSRLEGLPASESRAEPRKSLSNPRDWTFHSRTSRQKWPAKTRLSLATWHTRDWAAKTGQNWIFEIFRFLKQNTFQKHLKHSKIFLCLN